MGDPAKADRTKIPDMPWLSDPKWATTPGNLRVKANYQFIVDNLLDLTHVSYVHKNTLAGDPREATFADGAVDVLAVPFDGSAELKLGVNDAAYGRATLASAARAIAAARAGEVDAVVAAPHNQTSIAAARIPFDGYPTLADLTPDTLRRTCDHD